jgi:hypothetical protein
VTAEELLELASKKGHSVLRFDLPENKSLSVEDGNCFIGLDFRLGYAEEKECLAHELGHCEYGGFYNHYSGLDVREKAERRANKWAFLHLAPVGKIMQVVQNGINDTWELAECLETTDGFTSMALQFYQDAGIVFDK